MKHKSKKHVIAAAILAGGNSRRMGGIAKGLLQDDDNITIVHHLISELNRTAISDVVIIANDPKSYQACGIEVIADIRTGIGPMAGIESGLDHFAGRTDAVLFLPCDLPQITAKEISTLKKTFIAENSPAVFAVVDDFSWHPLCAVVSNDLKETVSIAIDRGQRKIRNIWRQVEAAKVQFPDDDAFFNINTLTDLARWRKAKKAKRIYTEASIAI